MAEHAAAERKSAVPAEVRGANAARGADSHAERLNRRSEAQLAAPARLLDARAAVEAAAPVAPLRPAGPRPIQRLPPNRTGLPDRLKAGVEALSGLSMDDVRVHRNSSEAARNGSLAFARGSDIHLGPGQERHLPHEAWHVVQQKQGRVRATGQLKSGVPINDNAGLEQDADRMGEAANRVGASLARSTLIVPPAAQRIVQRAMITGADHNGIVFAHPADLAKFNTVVADVVRMGPHVAPDVVLTIRLISEPDRIGTMPAETFLTHAPDPADPNDFTGIRVDLHKWYVEISSVGQIAAMITHEIGVHTLANAEMNAAELGAEALNNPIPYAQNVGARHVTLAPNPQLPADRRQADHVNVSKFNAIPLAGPPVPEARMERYIQTMLRMGDSIGARAPLDHGFATIAADQRDLMKTFLFDIARMMATDDGPALKVFWNAGGVAHINDWFYDEVIVPHAVAHPWVIPAYAGIRAGGMSLRAMLLSTAARAIYAQRSAILPTIGRGLAAIVGR